MKEREHFKAAELFGRAQTPPQLVRAYGEVKKALFKAQQSYKALYPKTYYHHLLTVVDEIIAGEHDRLFILPLKQGGAGTSLHMNINEVIAELTNERCSESFQIDPLEHLARYQSTNDTFSTALLIIVYRGLLAIEKDVIALQEKLVEKETLWNTTLLAGRTELQDALPMTVGQLFGSWTGMIERDRWRLHKLQDRVRITPLGGTAIGTSFSAPREFVFLAERYLRETTGLPLSRSQNLPDAIAHHDALAELASGYALLAGNLQKIANDLLLYTSSMVGELKHPHCQYGSTIMPHKTNPVILEYLKGVAIGISHESAKIREYAREGNLQLNAFLPFLLESFLTIQNDLARALPLLRERFFEAVTIDREKMMHHLLSSHVLLNTLRPVVGYHTLKELAQGKALQEVASLEELIALLVEKSELDEDFLRKWFDPDRLTTYGEGEK